MLFTVNLNNKTKRTGRCGGADTHLQTKLSSPKRGWPKKGRGGGGQSRGHEKGVMKKGACKNDLASYNQSHDSIPGAVFENPRKETLV